MDKSLDIATKFGKYLDEDQFDKARALLIEDCHYFIGDQIIKGNQAIMNLYEENMKEGRLKFDELIWGKSHIEKVGKQIYEVHFSDYLKHKGISHNYKCKQQLSLNADNQIIKIQHMELPGEKEALNKFLNAVGLAPN